MNDSSSVKPTNSLAAAMFALSREYLGNAPTGNSGGRGLAHSHSDEEDRFHAFMEAVDEAFKNRFAIEKGIELLKDNLSNTSKGDPEYQVPEFRYKVDKNKREGTFRLIPVSSSTEQNTTLLDFMDRSHKIKVLNKGAKILVDEQDVIRFVRFHSKENSILNFKQDSLGQTAEKMYLLYLEVLNSTKQLRSVFTKALNMTPLGELENSFSMIESEDYKELLRLFFQTVLPMINEDHYNKKAGKPAGTRRARTENISDQFKKQFLARKKVLFEHSSSVLTFTFWLRKMLRYIIQQNHEKSLSNTSDKLTARYFSVGVSYTIGEEEHSLFYIEDSCIIAPERSVQRADKKDTWVSVSKSEKLHRILKKDFFQILQQFVQSHLNPALEYYGFEAVSLTGQYIPEIKSRIENDIRRDIIRSGILGTSLTSMGEFRSNQAFLQAYIKYFHSKNENFKNFPKNEKIRMLTSEIAAGNTSILQMKYRKMKKTKDEVVKELLKNATSSDKRLIKELKTLKQILDGIQQIMETAKPGLKEVT